MIRKATAESMRWDVLLAEDDARDGVEDSGASIIEEFPQTGTNHRGQRRGDRFLRDFDGSTFDAVFETGLA